MHLPSPLVAGVLVRRYKRFLADVQLDDGRLVTAHCPNPGAMTTCGDPGWRVLLSRSDNPRRKLAWTWEISYSGQTAILVNTARPNAVVAEAIAAGQIEPLRGYDHLKREASPGRGRLDFVLESAGRPRCWVEVKSVTLRAADGRAAFPDAVTARGLRHLETLARRVRAGERAVQLYLVSRADVTGVRPADEIDPAYARGLRAAVSAGVEVLAYRGVVTPESVTVGERMEVLLQPIGSQLELL